MVTKPRAATATTPDLSLESASAGETPVNGLIVANGPRATPSNDPQEPDQWTGFRALSDDDIEKLATSLVDEIRLRGPFLCLSDFINRRPGTDAELARQGTLQAAIEKAEINGNLDNGSRALGSIAGAPFPEAGEGSRAAGIPGYITQADLLTPLGPTLQARSDSFTIRAYGQRHRPQRQGPGPRLVRGDRPARPRISRPRRCSGGPGSRPGFRRQPHFRQAVRGSPASVG